MRRPQQLEKETCIQGSVLLSSGHTVSMPAQLISMHGPGLSYLAELALNQIRLLRGSADKAYPKHLRQQALIVLPLGIQVYK